MGSPDISAKPAGEKQAGWLQFVDEAVDPVALGTELKRRAAGHRVDRRWRPRYGERSLREQAHSADELLQRLAHHLERLEALQDARAASDRLELAPSPAARRPVIGRLWGMVRRQAHDLVLYYVNIQAAHQSEIDHHLVEALRALAAENRRLRQQLEALHNEPSPADNSHDER